MKQVNLKIIIFITLFFCNKSSPMSNKTIKFCVLILIFLFNFVSCSLFLQNDFITSQIILEENDETIFYDVFQVGMDNYDIKFKYINNNDTVNLFECYLDDAVYSTRTFECYKKNDTLIIKAKPPVSIKDSFKKTKNGLNVLLIEVKN